MQKSAQDIMKQETEGKKSEKKVEVAKTPPFNFNEVDKQVELGENFELNLRGGRKGTSESYKCAMLSPDNDYLHLIGEKN